MSRDLVTLVYSRKVGSLLRKSVLTAMADRANDDGTGIWISKQRIADEIEASRQGVVDAIKDMIADGILIEIGQRPCANGWTMEYSIAVDVVCALEVRKQHMGDPPKYVGAQKPNAPPHPVEPTPQMSGGHPPTGFTQTVLNHPQPTEAKASVPCLPMKAAQQITGTSRKPKPPQPTPDLQPALDAYNRLAERLKAERGGKAVWPVVTVFNAKRQAALRARIKEHGLDAWGTVLRKAYASPLCTGLKNSWAADFEFLTSPTGFLKTLEGNYDDRSHHTATGSGSGARNTSGNGSRLDAFDRLAERLSGGSAGPDLGNHDEPGAGEGYVIDVAPTRLAG